MSYEEKVIRYFKNKGPENTDSTLELAKKRALELGIKDIVVASSHGNTARRALKVFRGFNLVVVTISMGFKEEGWTMEQSERDALATMGAKVLTCTHALGDDVDSSFSGQSGARSYKEVVAETLRRFSQGTKVAVEISMMATDAGLIEEGKEVIAIAGTGEGADTALVLKSVCPRRFLELEIREIIAKPRRP